MRHIIYTFNSLLLAATLLTAEEPMNNQTVNMISYGYETVDGLDIFYREAGDPNKSAIVLPHGFPSSSHMYRNVLQALKDQYYLIAPDYPGFGHSSYPSADSFTYSFDNIAEIMDKFLGSEA